MAVLQHQVDEESFVFSVPFRSNEADDLYVIATHAIFHKKTHDGKKAPAAVVGYRFKQSSFFDRFMEITSETDRVCLKFRVIICMIRKLRHRRVNNFLF